MATTEEELDAAKHATVEQPPVPEITPDAEAQPAAAEEEQEPERSPYRLAVATCFPVVAAAIMVGGIFTGASSRAYTIVAGLLGVGLGLLLSRMRGRPFLTNVLMVAGIFAIGLLMVGPTNIFRVQSLVNESIAASNVLRPPVRFDPGWRAVSGWLMGMVGLASVWVAIVFKKPALALLLPLPIAGIAAISVPEDDNTQIFSGIAVLVLFAISLGILSSEQSVGEDGTAPSIGYELRKAAKAVPLLAILTAVLYFVGQSNLLFPDSLIDPAQEPQKPKTPPLTEVEDRVLFEVTSKVSGPWRTGVLDVYDPKDGHWKLPPFAASQFEDVDESGVVDPDFQSNIQATFAVAGLGGAVLPGLPNPAGIIASGPRLAFDDRAGTLRLVEGTATPGLRYTVTAASLPAVGDLKAIKTFSAQVPKGVKEFQKIPDPPAAVKSLLDQAKAAGPSEWERFDFARTWVLDNVTAEGTGRPVAIPLSRVEDIIGGSKHASPFEIVATQAMLARWIGIPSRIGYGFDGGDEVEGKLQVRPRHGAAFVEVYFPGFKWLPVIGTPRKAEPTVGSDPSQQKVDPSVLPSDDVAVQIFLPTFVAPESIVAKQIAVTVLVALPILLFLLLVYTLWPALRKARIRGRRKDAALAAGVRARVAYSYADFRDYATDFGFLYPTDTPLMFLDRFQDDEEHTEFAWLTTRVLWGDLQDDSDPMLATVAEELSRSLKRRLASAQPSTIRVVAVVSRLSLRHPYAPETDLTPRDHDKGRKGKREKKERAHDPIPA